MFLFGFFGKKYDVTMQKYQKKLCLSLHIVSLKQGKYDPYASPAWGANYTWAKLHHPQASSRLTQVFVCPVVLFQAECDLNDPRCVLDSLFRIQEQIRSDPRIKAENKLTDSDLHLMSRDVIIAGRFCRPQT